MSARSPSTFRQRLKTFLSSASFPAIIIDNHYHIPHSSLVDPKVIFCARVVTTSQGRVRGQGQGLWLELWLTHIGPNNTN